MSRRLTLIFANTNNDRKLPNIPSKHIEPIITKAITNLSLKQITGESTSESVVTLEYVKLACVELIIVVNFLDSKVAKIDPYDLWVGQVRRNNIETVPSVCVTNAEAAPRDKV